MAKMEQLIGIGIIFILVGFLIIFFGMPKGTKETSTKTKVAVGGFIGPIPFGFGNDKSLIWFVTLLSSALFLAWLFFSFKLGK